MRTNMSSSTSAATSFAAPPSNRASWTGRMQLDKLSVPVKAYPSTVTSSGPLCQLHAGCGQRIAYRKCCPKHGEVPNGQIAKGYPYEPDQLVELNDDDLAAIRPDDDKTLRLERVIDPAQLDLIMLAGRSLYLVAANPIAMAPYGVVLRALQNTAKWALGRVVFSGHRQLVVVRPTEDRLVLHTLHDPALCRAVTPMDTDISGVDSTELKALAKVLSRKNGRVAWNEYVDDTEVKLVALVRAKLQPAKPTILKLNGRKRAAAPKARRKATSRKRAKAA
jgi:DNA end-binding protein Ku